MNEFARPLIFASRCLGFERCRWNGETVNDPLVEKLREVADFITLCPERDIGLGIPRDPIRVVERSGALRLMQPATGRDCTAGMLAYCASVPERIGAVVPDGFILKSRSPSCGIKDVKVYADNGSGATLRKAAGFFGDYIQKTYPSAAVEDEMRLSNFRLREAFLARIFGSAAFRAVANSGSHARLVEYHARNKYLFMAYSDAKLRVLGRIVASGSAKNFAETIARYQPVLGGMFESQLKPGPVVNVLMHCMGYFDKKITRDEKKFFLDLLEKYRMKAMPLLVPVTVLRGWAVKYGEEYLLQQTLFAPYPESLADISDSGKGRDL